MRGRVTKTDNKVIIFIDNNKRLKDLHGKEITIKVDNKYYFCKVIRYARRYVIYIPATEDRESLLRKKEVEFEILT